MPVARQSWFVAGIDGLCVFTGGLFPTDVPHFNDNETLRPSTIWVPDRDTRFIPPDTITR